jgi:hypothetical protein
VGSCSTGYKDVWFVFMPPCSGAYKIDTCGPGLFDTVLTAYGSCGGAELACNDDGPTGCGFTSTITGLVLSAGVPVWIRVASYSSTNVGSFPLNVNQVFAVVWSSPLGFGSLQFDLNGGPLGGTYYHAIALIAGGFPTGWFYGIDIPIPEIVGQVQFGWPFVGALDSCGHAQFGPLPGLPPGLTFYSVGLASPGPLYIPTAITAPVSFVIP